MTTPDRVVVVGSSVGGVRAAQALRAGGFAGDVVVIGAEDVDPYDKPPLSKGVLSGEQGPRDIALLAGGWGELGIEARLGVPAVGLDTARKHVLLGDGDAVPYQALVIATGARPRTLPGPAAPFVHTVRELRDAEALRARIRDGAPVVVVGSGFIGAEVAATARALGADTTIVEAAEHPFARVLGPEVGAVMTALHTERGVRVLSGAAVASVEPLSDGSGVVHLTDGRRLEAGTVVVGIGVQPCTTWLDSSGVALDDGVVTDEYCRVAGAENVFAIGDVARWYDVRSGVRRRVEHWTNAVEQARLVAHNLLHPDDLKIHETAPYFWSDQHGVKVQMVGLPAPGDRVELLRCVLPSGERLLALWSRGQEFTAAVALGWPRVIVSCRRAWEQSASLAEVRSMVARLCDRVEPAGDQPARLAAGQPLASYTR